MDLFKALKSHPFLGSSVVALPLIILFSNLVGISNNCFESYDFGLYQQAIFRMAGNFELNPYLTIRGLNIFNDHFMPILFTAVPFVWLTGFLPAGLILFEWLTFIFALYLIYRWKGPDLKTFFTAAILLLLSKGILTGLIFPIHPGVWSVPLWIFLVKALYDKNEKAVLIAASTLFLFRESFPFCVVGLSVYYLLNKNWKNFAILLGISLIQIIFIYKLRPMILGPVYDYGGGFLSSLGTDPIAFLADAWKSLDFKSPFKLFYPFVLPMTFVLLKEIKSFKDILSHPFMAVMGLISPLIFLHFLANKFHYQYGTPLVTPLTALIIFAPSFSEMIKSKKWIIPILILFAASSSSTYTKFAKLGLAHKTNKCQINHERRSKTKELKEIVKTIGKNSTMFSTKRIVPSIIHPDLNVYVPYYLFSTYLEQYDYLLIEKNYGGDADSVYSPEKFNRVVNACKPQVKKEIINNDHFFLAKGEFKKSCYSQLFWVNR